MSLKIHPLAMLLPETTENEKIAIVDSMKQNGFMKTEPIVVLDNMILDGRTREWAASKAEVKPIYENFKNGISPIEFVLSRNVKRRHLTQSQKAACAALAYNEMRKKAGLKRLQGVELYGGVYKMFGVSAGLMQRAVWLSEKSRDDLARVHKGEASLSTVYFKARTSFFKNGSEQRKQGGFPIPERVTSYQKAFRLIQDLHRLGLDFEMKFDGQWRARFKDKGGSEKESGPTRSFGQCVKNMWTLVAPQPNFEMAVQKASNELYDTGNQ